APAVWELDGPIILGPNTSNTLMNDIESLLRGGRRLQNEFLVDGIDNGTDSVVTGYVTGGAKGILGNIEGHHDGTDGAVHIAGLGTKHHVQEGQSGHDGAAGGAGGGHHGNAQSHDEGHHSAQA